MFSTEEFLLISEITKRALRKMSKEGNQGCHFCNCEDLYLSLVALYGDERTAFLRLDSASQKVANVINKTYPIKDNIRMGYLGQPANSIFHGFIIR